MDVIVVEVVVVRDGVVGEVSEVGIGVIEEVLIVVDGVLFWLTVDGVLIDVKVWSETWGGGDATVPVTTTGKVVWFVEEVELDGVVVEDSGVVGDVWTAMVVIEVVVGDGGWVGEVWNGVGVVKIVGEDVGFVGEVWWGVGVGDVWTGVVVVKVVDAEGGCVGDVCPGWVVEDKGSVGVGEVRIGKVDVCVDGFVVYKFDAVVVAVSVDVIVDSKVVVGTVDGVWAVDEQSTVTQHTLIS